MFSMPRSFRYNYSFQLYFSSLVQECCSSIGLFYPSTAILERNIIVDFLSFCMPWENSSIQEGGFREVIWSHYLTLTNFSCRVSARISTKNIVRYWRCLITMKVEWGCSVSHPLIKFVSNQLFELMCALVLTLIRKVN